MYCPECGERNANGARFCAACGLTLPVDAAPAPAPAQAPQILRSPLARPTPLRPPPLDPLPPSGRAGVVDTNSVPRRVPEQPLPSTTSAGAQPGPVPTTAQLPLMLTDGHAAPFPLGPSVVPAPVTLPPAARPPPAIATPTLAAKAPVVAPPVVAPPVVAPPALAAKAPVDARPVVTPPVVTPHAEADPTSRAISPATGYAPKSPSKTPVVAEALAATVIEEFRDDDDLFDDDDVTDPGRPAFDDDDSALDTAQEFSLEGSSVEEKHPVVVEHAARPLPRVSFAPPGVVRYLIAALIDGVLAGGPALALALMLTPDDGAPFLERVIQTLLLTPSAMLVFIVTSALLSTVHHAALLPRRGATVGGLLTGVGLRVHDGSVAKLPRAAIRGLATAFGAFVFLAGPLYALWVDDNRRALADRIAGTRLVTRGHT
jgi:uncharacterized RDD family membrane protein YckC